MSSSKKHSELDVTLDLNKIEKVSGKFNKGGKSLINAAKGNIFEFPVFISSSVPLDYATATTSLLEQVYASYLQMAISINPVADGNQVKQGRQFSHLKTDTNKYLEYTDMSYAHDACHSVYNENGCVFEFNMISIEDADARVINEYCEYQPLSEFSHYFQEAQRPRRDHITSREDYDENGETRSSSETLPSAVQQDLDEAKLTKAQADAKHADSNADRQKEKLEAEVKKLKAEANDEMLEYNKRIKKAEADIKELDKEIKEKSKSAQAEDLKRMKDERRLAAKKLRDYEADHKSQQTKLQTEIQKNVKQLEKMMDEEKYRDEDRKMLREKHLHDTKTKAPQFLDETKINKLNTMKPLMMTVNLSVMDDENKISRPIEYIVGVKTHSRLIDADILPEVAEYPIKEMNKLSRKAKWRAGELKFFKDILFNIKQKKQTAIDSRDSKRKWYRRLYNLAHMKGDAPSTSVIEGNSPFKAFMNALSGKGSAHGVMPNVTIIMTKSDVDNVKSQTNIDLLKGSTAKKFCKELFLIGLVVIDNDAESIKMMLPDLHNDFEVHSLASVNKQLASLDTVGTKTRDMFKVLGR